MKYLTNILSKVKGLKFDLTKKIATPRICGNIFKYKNIFIEINSFYSRLFKVSQCSLKHIISYEKIFMKESNSSIYQVFLLTCTMCVCVA